MVENRLCEVLATVYFSNGGEKMLSYLGSLNRLSYDGDGRSRFFGSIQNLNNISSISKLVISTDSNIEFGTLEDGTPLEISAVEGAFINGDQVNGDVVMLFGMQFSEVSGYSLRLELINTANWIQIDENEENPHPVFCSAYVETPDGLKTTNSTIAETVDFIAENLLLFIPGKIDKIHIFYE